MSSRASRGPTNASDECDDGKRTETKKVAQKFKRPFENQLRTHHGPDTLPTTECQAVHADTVDLLSVED